MYYVTFTDMRTGRPIGVTSSTSNVPYRFIPTSVQFTQTPNVSQDTATVEVNLSDLPAAITSLIGWSTRDDTPNGLSIAYGWRYGLAIHDANTPAYMETPVLFYGAITGYTLNPAKDKIVFQARDLSACLSRQLANRTQYVGNNAGIMVNIDNNTDHTWTVTGSLFGLVAMLAGHNSWYPANYIQGRDTSGAHVKTINGLELRSISEELEEVFNRQYAPMVWFYGYCANVNGYPRYEARLQVLYSGTIQSEPKLYELLWTDVATVKELTVNGENTAVNRWFTSNNTNMTNGQWVYYARTQDTDTGGGGAQLLFNQWDNVSVKDTALSHISRRVPACVVTFKATPDWEHNRSWAIPGTTAYRPVRLGDIMQIASFRIGDSPVYILGMVTAISHENGERTYTLGKCVQTLYGVDTTDMVATLALLNATQDDSRSLSGIINSVSREVARLASPARG